MKSKYAHIEWLQLDKNKGVVTECAIMKRFDNGDLLFFSLAAMDNIDKTRLVKIITRRDATMYELWDLMSHVTLGNGMNALAYFHQLTKVLTPDGQIIEPSLVRRGVPGKMQIDAFSPREQAEAEAEAGDSSKKGPVDETHDQVAGETKSAAKKTGKK